MIENLTCPNCGAPLDVATASGNVIVCPYCSNKLLLSGPAVPATSGKKDEEEEEEEDFEIAYYPPSVSISEFEAKCQKLFDEDPLLPDDIFREVNFQEVKSVFLPTWMFRGHCKGKIGWTRADKYDCRLIDENFALRTTANYSQVVPRDIIERLYAFRLDLPERPMILYSDPFVNEYAPSVQFEVDDTFANIDNQRRLFKEAYSNAYIKQYTFPSDKNVSSHLNFDFEEDFDECDVEYVPFYIIGFRYKEKTYHIACDAVTGDALIYNLPEDEQRKKSLSESMSTGAVLLMVAIVFVPPLLWLFGPMKFTTLLWLAIPALIALSVISIVSINRAEAKKKKIIEDARKARKDFR